MSQPVALGRIAPGLEEFDGAFLHCTDCAAVHRIRRADRAPFYRNDGSASPADDLQRFLDAHVDHRLQVLRRSSDAEMVSHARWDPMCRVAWEVSDGESHFVVTFGRTDLERPREYWVRSGHLRLESETVEVDTEMLRRVFDEALFPNAAPPSHVEALTQRCVRLVAVWPLERLDLVDEVREDPSIQLACLPQEIAAELRQEVRRRFGGPDGERLLDAIDGDLRRHIPVIRLTRRYRVESDA